MLVETPIEMCRRHVLQGSDYIARQEALIARLAAANQPTEEARSFLRLLVATQKLHAEHLARLIAEAD